MSGTIVELNYQVGMCSLALGLRITVFRNFSGCAETHNEGNVMGNRLWVWAWSQHCPGAATQGDSWNRYCEHGSAIEPLLWGVKIGTVTVISTKGWSRSQRFPRQEMNTLRWSSMSRSVWSRTGWSCASCIGIATVTELKGSTAGTPGTWWERPTWSTGQGSRGFRG